MDPNAKPNRLKDADRDATRTREPRPYRRDRQAERREIADALLEDAGQ